MKDRAELNKHRDDGKAKQDKLLRQLQQRVLSLQRVYPCLHAALQDEELAALGQQFWWLLLDMEKHVLECRREASIPGSLQQDNPVFSADDLKVEKASASIFGIDFSNAFPKNHMFFSYHYSLQSF